MINDNYAKRFIELKPKYEKLGVNVKQALEALLQEKDIPYLSINYRVKEQNSFLEKIERKKYEEPFLETEDLCGIRIICYFQNDIDKIQMLINNEFNVSENQSKQELLSATEFGYRSTHLIAKIKSEWTITPAFRGIDNLKFEIQIRTILMHSWAEIEHKLAYKSESQIPKDIRRKFSFISAILEAADIQFEEIKDKIIHNKQELIAEAEQNQRFNDSVELNLDNLQAFLEYAFKDRRKDINLTRYLLEDMQNYNISFSDLIKGYEDYKDVLSIIEEEEYYFINQHRSPDDEIKLKWTQSGATRTLFELISEKYRNEKASEYSKDILKKHLK